ncbi:TIGR02221 family CRISPR-associated protein [Planktothrix agardhii]|jgi:CRISPR-associated DxTHG motif protein|uniref:TIGR02221 family CRISPR-associated protein n=1 Tax=Planktothrix agardhii TaxID=1160 RepID=UPI001D0A215E|nr:TIGR02221 family CRISPR-associated protein [Planktothrix agardhii]MCB8762213.1 TIGR02221 family CRISPR-associated protein [Planktothrix agardhii 1813]
MSKTKIITFLGERGALQTTYIHQGNSYTGGVFAEALHQFCQYDTMLVCVTEKAKANTWPVLEALKEPRIQAIDIQNGTTTDEMWQTFKTITDYVDEEDRVIFDITHGLRSLPFLVFLFAAYLKAAKNVTINAVYYGALELGNSKEGIPAPVIDLSEFVSMIDWLTATTRFVEIGDGQALANLLNKAIPSGQELRDNPYVRPLRDQLKKSYEAIDNISLALSITRPIETMESATQLEETLKKAASSFSQRAKPFSLLAEKVIQEYGQFALKNSKETANFTKNLQIQLAMIKWYIDRNQVVQASTLAREWLVSVLVLRFGLEQQMFDNRTGRKYVENALNNAVEKRKPEPRPITPSCCDEQLDNLPEADDIAAVWGKMTELRNDIAHVGMNLRPKTAIKLKQNAVFLHEKLRQLAKNLISN